MSPDSNPPIEVVFHTGQLGGPVRSLEQEIRWLAESSPVDVLVPFAESIDPVYSELGGEVRVLPFSIVDSPESLKDAISLFRRLVAETRVFRQWLRHRKPGVVLVVTTVLPASVLAAWLERIPVVIYAAEIPARNVPERGGRVKSLLRWTVIRSMIRMQSRMARKTIACSKGVADLMAHPQEVVVSYPPVDPGRCEGDGAAFRSTHGISPKAPLLACVGSISAGRGQDVLIEAIPRMLEIHPDLRVVIEGVPFPRKPDLDYSGILDRLIEEMDLTRVVVRTRRTDPIADLLSAAEVVVNPATFHNETFGRVAFEAGFAGTPMVASKLGVLPEVHRDGETILFVPPRDPNALASAVLALLDDPDRAEKVAAGAAATARRLASPDRALDLFEQAIREVDSAIPPRARG